MKRADKNHWVILSAIVCAANVAPVVLFLKTEMAVAIGVTCAIAAVLFYAAWQLTCTPRWWVLPLAGSPLIVIPLLVGLLFILAILGIVPVP